MAPVVDEEFVAHLFVFENGPLKQESYQELRRLWTECRTQLGTTSPIAGLACPDQLPERLEELPGGVLLAAQERPGHRDRQCVLRRAGHVLVVSVMMIQPRPERTGRLARSVGNTPVLGWREFAQLWSRVSRYNNEVVLGEVVLLLGRTQSKRSRWEGATEKLATSLTALLPHDETRRRGWEHGGTTSPGGFAVWDTHQGQLTGTRELLVVARPDADRELGTWVWSDNGSADLPSFAEYLLHASLLRYQSQVLETWRGRSDRPGPISATNEVSAVLTRLFSAGSENELRVSQEHLRQLQRGELVLDELVDRLRQVTTTSRDSLEQMEKAWGRNDGSCPIIANDAELARSLVRDSSAEHDAQRARLDRTRRHRELVADELTRSGAVPSTRSITPRSRSTTQPEDKSRNVFVVHGRDTEMKEIVYSILQAFDLRPFDWEDLVAATGSTSPSIMDVVRLAPTIAQAIVVLMTPDDAVQLHPALAGSRDPESETALNLQARPNVILEMGMSLMVAPERTIVLEAGALRPIGDMGGVNVIRFDGRPYTILKLARRLEVAGCPVNDRAIDLYRTGRFSDLSAFSRTPPSPDP
ncbi:nucleotide-binding protein [Lentzea alba]|uniref:CATRA conflict system CASPASE/TPR repeat-associated protein n=1 Tax=Lentzea alba TaxID=2714351 RepID=UPI0039BFDE5C